MLYPTLNQPYVFIMMFLTGLACGLFFDASNFLAQLFNKNKIITQILYTISTFLSIFTLFFVNLDVNFGQFRIFIVLTFLFSFLIERWTIGNFLNKLFIKSKKQFNIKLPCFKLKKHRKTHSKQEADKNN